METNESILVREVVALNERKKVGKLTGLRVDCDTLAVSHYILSSASTGSELVLPFAQSLGVGDTFMTIQGSDAVLATTNPEATKVLKEGYLLLNTDVYSRVGNKLGAVTGFEFDPVYGKVLSIALDTQKSFGADNFIFFSPEFVFVDDGELAAADIRATGADATTSLVTEADVPAAADVTGTVPDAAADESILAYEEMIVFDNAVAGESAEGADTAAPGGAGDVTANFMVVDAFGFVPDTTPVDTNSVFGADTGAKEPDAQETPVENTGADTAVGDAGAGEQGSLPADASPDLSPEATAEDDVTGLLVGSVLIDDVVSDDGAFKVSKGTVLTQGLVDEAKKHDALLLLTVSIDV
ncbi:MAG: hypothetical protein LBU07_06235 [Coriobacteriales bacterium]|jgi:sporulation protein YlmC with PRC-barrel domain|nr:hypothetical protein [Coriobacteriales bacterium]